MAFKRFGRDVAVYGGTDLLFRLAQFIALPLYAFHLSIADFGVLALLTVSGTLLGMLLNLGVNNAVQRFYYDAGTRETERPLLVSTGLAQLLLSGTLVVGIALVVLYGLRDEIRAEYGIAWALVLITLLTVLPDQIAQYCLDAVRLQFAPLKFCAIAIVKNLLGVLLGLWFLLAWDMGVAGLLLGPLVSAALAAPLGLLMIRRDLVLRVDPAIVRRVFHFGYPYMLAGAAYWAFGSIDRWMLIELSDLEQLGLFSIAFKLTTALTFVIAAFAQAWSPIAYKMTAEEPRYRDYFSRILSTWFFALALLGLALGLFAPELLRLLTPPQYWGAAPMLAIGAAGIVLYGTTLITAMGVSLEKRTMLLSLSAWLAAVANLLINLFLIPRFGGVGAAVATFLSYVVLTGSLLYWSQKLHPLPLEHAKLAYCCGVVALILAAAGAVEMEVSAARIAVKVALLLAVVAGAFAVRLLSPALYRQLRLQLAG
ncbi:MAG TPA: oligosaccharide flippase family protein [Allosphingosinicella sp.]|nr:oligosaccharide flippase family protein [Allosphingosinicella sp.]